MLSKKPLLSIWWFRSLIVIPIHTYDIINLSELLPASFFPDIIAWPGPCIIEICDWFLSIATLYKTRSRTKRNLKHSKYLPCVGVWFKLWYACRGIQHSNVNMTVIIIIIVPNIDCVIFPIIVPAHAIKIDFCSIDRKQSTSSKKISSRKMSVLHILKTIANRKHIETT